MSADQRNPDGPNIVIRWKRPGSPVLFGIVILTVLFIGWGTDYKSCQRQVAPRRDDQVRVHRTQALWREEAHVYWATAQYYKAQGNMTMFRVNNRLANTERALSYRLPVEAVPGCKKIFPPTN